MAVFIAGGSVIYKTKIQRCVALSSTESELYAASEAGKCIKYICSILKFLDIDLPTPTPLYEDNKSTIAIANSDKATKRLRHVDLRYFAIIEWVQCGDLTLESISTELNLSDCLTKSLNPLLHHQHTTT